MILTVMELSTYMIPAQTGIQTGFLQPQPIMTAMDVKILTKTQMTITMEYSMSTMHSHLTPLNP